MHMRSSRDAIIGEWDFFNLAENSNHREIVRGQGLRVSGVFQENIPEQQNIRHSIVTRDNRVVVNWQALRGWTWKQVCQYRNKRYPDCYVMAGEGDQLLRKSSPKK